MSSKFPKVETFATLSAEVAEYRKVMPMLQAQAQQAMMMAAQEKGKYLHVLKLFAALLAQNSLKGIETVIFHKSVVDQPDTINIAREGFPKDAKEGEETGYSYRVVGDAELAALNAPPEGDSGPGTAVHLDPANGILPGADPDAPSDGIGDDDEGSGAKVVALPSPAERNKRKVLRKKG